VVDNEGIWSREGTNIEDLPDPFAPAAEPPLEQLQKPKRKRWRYVFYAFAALFFITLIWLILTAPLSRALEPLDDPAMLLVSAEGQPIARRGAMKEEPVEVAKLKPETSAAFVSIEDRRFYRHWGVDPRGIGRAMMANVRAACARADRRLRSSWRRPASFRRTAA
jgi:penicillin-binding protein 1A